MPPTLAVSVVIPTYNRAVLVARAVRSALAALVPGDEIIVVDDGSTDGTAAVIAAFGPPVRFVDGLRGGAGAARNRGIDAAVHPLVAFLDSDDEWTPDKVALQRAVLERDSTVVFAFSDLFGRSTRGDEAKFLRTWHRDARTWDEILGPGRLFSEMAPLPAGRADFRVHVGSLYLAEMQSHYVATSTLVVHRERAGTAFRFAEDLPVSEDKECFARLASVGPAAYLDCETTYQWEHAGPRITDDNNGYTMPSARLRIMERVWGRDAAFLERHRGAYEDTLREQHLERARWLLVRGRTAEARADLARVAGVPWSYRLLAALPGPVVRGFLNLRRLVSDESAIGGSIDLLRSLSHRSPSGAVPHRSANCSSTSLPRQRTTSCASRLD